MGGTLPGVIEGGEDAGVKGREDESPERVPGGDVEATLEVVVNLGSCVERPETIGVSTLAQIASTKL